MGLLLQAGTISANRYCATRIGDDANEMGLGIAVFNDQVDHDAQGWRSLGVRRVLIIGESIIQSVHCPGDDRRRQ